MEKNITTINYIRGFNRFYTNILGLIDQHILDSNYSLTEARILFELSENSFCTAIILSSKLNIDKSYLSRILSKFEKDGLIFRKLSCNDSRVSLIKTTDKGTDTIKQLISKSNSQIEQFLAPLNCSECEEIRTAMGTIIKHFTKATAPLAIRPFTHDDIDFVISHQIKLYENEYGFTTKEWKAYVTDGVNHLVDQFDHKKDCMYILEYDGQPSGCIAIAHASDDAAQLRFFFVKETLRGLGAGNKLIDKAIDFCKEIQYKQVFLWTFITLDAARHLYAKKGFQIKETHENLEWGTPILEECWSLEL